jgi:hypothetical protein
MAVQDASNWRIRNVFDPHTALCFFHPMDEITNIKSWIVDTSKVPEASAKPSHNSHRSMTKADKQRIHAELLKAHNQMTIIAKMIETVFGKQHRLTKRARDFLTHLEHLGDDVG